MTNQSKHLAINIKKSPKIDLIPVTADSNIQEDLKKLVAVLNKQGIKVVPSKRDSLLSEDKK